MEQECADSISGVILSQENKDRISSIEEAILLIDEARCLVDNAVSDLTINRHYESYGKYGFNQLLGDGNPYDNSLLSLIEEIKEGEE